MLLRYTDAPELMRNECQEFSWQFMPTDIQVLSGVAAGDPLMGATLMVT